MNLIVIRHAIAKDRRDFAKKNAGADDGLRPLTKKGKAHMRQAAGGLATLVRKVDLLASSPLVRAAQTADIVGDALNTPKPIQIAELTPNARPNALLKWLQRHAEDESTIAVVGHEPHLSTFVSWLLTGLDDPFVEMKKGGVAIIDFEDGLAAGKGKLRGLLTPKQLRGLSR
jgi:phosphohistidine phosphatase